MSTQTGDRSGAVGSADPAKNGDLLPPGTIFKRAKAALEPAGGSKAAGTAKLEEVTSGVRIEVMLHDAPPNTRLGVHVVDRSDCDAQSIAAAEHLNPRHSRHGLPGSGEQHLGDLGNISIDEHGNGALLIMTSGGNLREHDPRSLVDRAIVVDAREDDGQPQALKPAACAVIRAS